MPTNLFDKQDARAYWETYLPTVALAVLCALVACVLLFTAFMLGTKYGASQVKVPERGPLQIECVPVPGIDKPASIRNAS
jgi:hypothetical protein